MDVNHLAFHMLHPYHPSPTEIPINYPVFYPVDMATEQYGNKGSVEQTIDKIKPDITAFLCDSFMLEWMLNDEVIEDESLKLSGFNEKQIETIKTLGFKRFVKKFDKIKSKTKTLFYFPFDSDTVYENADKIIGGMDIKVAMSKWAKSVLKKGTGMDCHVIPHGVDTNMYRPLSESQKIELKKQNGLEGKFVVGMISRNQTRKSWPVLFKGFAEFAKDKPDVFLFAGCDPKDPQGWRLDLLAQTYGIADKVKFGHTRYDLGHKDHVINMMHNIFDVHAMMTSGEGWGLTITESMAAGIPNILTDYTTSSEIAEDCALYVKPLDFIIGQKNTNRALPDWKQLVTRLNRMYKDEKLRKRLGERGRKLVTKKYSWERVVGMWQQLLETGKIEDKYEA